MTDIVPPAWVKIPTKVTLDKYGLDEQSWLAILQDQGWKCPICLKASTTGKFVVDHFHQKGFKKMSAQQKRRWIRGITCWWDNSAYLGRGITIEKSENVTKYLKAFEKRRPPF